MHPVAAFIQKEGSKPDTVFVFPSEIAARLWLEASLDILKKGSLPADRFIAWDRFKETAVRSAVAGRQPVSGRLRKLYALSFAKRNAATAKPLVTELIPEAYA
ncbi:MAG TPA: PD-(D/E)XK nuclease family protein, partial [Treponemataceae bacterium]|nr:PD-(D/E)XK nuclease family protein [Treponemataceae bacterium]